MASFSALPYVLAGLNTHQEDQLLAIHALRLSSLSMGRSHPDGRDGSSHHRRTGLSGMFQKGIEKSETRYSSWHSEEMNVHCHRHRW